MGLLIGGLVLAGFQLLKKRNEHDKVTEITLKEHPTTVAETDLAKLAKTDTILIDPSVVALIFAWAANHPKNEVGALLIGQPDGRFLKIHDLVRAENVGTATEIDFTPRDFERARAKTGNGRMVVGWAHSHPTYTAFMSGTDQRFQSQGQGLYPDYVGLVIDPFRPRGVEFAFYRVTNDEVVQLPHHYWRRSE